MLALEPSMTQLQRISVGVALLRSVTPLHLTSERTCRPPTQTPLQLGQLRGAVPVASM